MKKETKRRERMGVGWRAERFTFAALRSTLNERKPKAGCGAATRHRFVFFFISVYIPMRMETEIKMKTKKKAKIHRARSIAMSRHESARPPTPEERAVVRTGIADVASREASNTDARSKVCGRAFAAKTSVHQRRSHPRRWCYREVTSKRKHSTQP
jgi:hypothetical protein